MNDTHEVATIHNDGFEISANDVSVDELRESLKASPDAPPTPGEGTAVADRVESAAAAPEPKTARSRDGKFKSIQAEIDADVARREAAKRDADAEEARLATVRAERQRLETPAAPPRQQTQTEPPTVAKKPVLDDFADAPEPWTAYQDALIGYTVSEALKSDRAARQQQDAQTAAQNQAHAAVNAMRDRLKASVGDVTAFAAKLNPALNNFRPMHELGPNEPVTAQTAIADAIIASSIPDKLLLHFTEHPDELDRIAALPPHMALRETGILEGKLSVAAASHGPASRSAVSAAPPPTKPLGGSPLPAHSGPPGDDATDEQHEAYWGPKRKALRRA